MQQGRETRIAKQPQLEAEQAVEEYFLLNARAYPPDPVKLQQGVETAPSCRYRKCNLEPPLYGRSIVLTGGQGQGRWGGGDMWLGWVEVFLFMILCGAIYWFSIVTRESFVRLGLSGAVDPRQLDRRLGADPGGALGCRRWDGGEGADCVIRCSLSLQIADCFLAKPCDMAPMG